jgi:hypothetical protein
LKFDEIVANYVAARDAKEDADRRHTESMKPLVEVMGQVEQLMLAKLNELGVKSLRTDHGTIIKSVKTSVTVGSWDDTFGFIQKNELWHFLNHAVSKTAVEGYMDEHGEPPPGVNVSRIATVQFRRS